MMAQLMESLKSDNEHFKYMLGLLPPQLLLAKEDEDSSEGDDSEEEEENNRTGMCILTLIN